MGHNGYLCFHTPRNARGHARAASAVLRLVNVGSSCAFFRVSWRDIQWPPSWHAKGGVSYIQNVCFFIVLGFHSRFPERYGIQLSPSSEMFRGTWCIEAKISKVMTQGRVKSAAWEPNKKPCFNGFNPQKTPRAWTQGCAVFHSNQTTCLRDGGTKCCWHQAALQVTTSFFKCSPVRTWYWGKSHPEELS